MANKGHINTNEIIIKKENKTIIEGRELSEAFNKHANIMEKIRLRLLVNHSSISRTKQNSSILCFPCGNKKLRLLKEIDVKKL